MVQNQIPNGPKDMICPLHRQPMVKVCKRCPLWINLRGKSNGQEVDDWRCSLAWLPVLLVEIGRQTHQTGAVVESFRNETVKTETARNSMFAHMINIKQKALE